MFQLHFDSFDLEESDTCLYDSLTILADVEGTEEVGRRKNFFCSLICALGIHVDVCVDVVVVVFVAVLCGGSTPPPVLPYHRFMVLHFWSDISVARRGFHATVAFISQADAWAVIGTDSHRLTGATSQQKSSGPSLDLSAVAITAVSLAHMQASSLDAVDDTSPFGVTKVSF